MNDSYVYSDSWGVLTPFKNLQANVIEQVWLGCICDS